MASAASGLHKAEVFVHPSYGRAVRATERIPAGTVVLKERPFFALLPSDAITAEAAKARASCGAAARGVRARRELALTPLRAGAQAVAALRCEPSVPARMLAFCAAPEALRARILQLFDGGGPAQWPTAVPDSDTFPCAPPRAAHLSQQSASQPSEGFARWRLAERLNAALRVALAGTSWCTRRITRRPWRALWRRGWSRTRLLRTPSPPTRSRAPPSLCRSTRTPASTARTRRP
jgi:hypothetical protein